MKKILYSFALVLVLGALTLPAVSSADGGRGNGHNKDKDNRRGDWNMGNRDSWNYTYSNRNYDARLQSLIAELSRLQALLVQLQNANHNNSNCDYLRLGNSSNYRYNCNTSFNNQGVISITVDFDDDAADVVIRYRDGDRDEFSIDADTREEAIDFIVEETDLTEATVRAFVRFTNDDDDDDNDNDDDVDSIDVTIDEDDNDATARVRFEDGDTTTYHIDSDVEDEIIEELADLLDMDEDDVEDITDFDFDNNNDNDDDIDNIEVDIDESDNDAVARVEFEDGDVDTYNIDSDDEDDIIEELADLLDVDEDEIEDVIEFDYHS